VYKKTKQLHYRVFLPPLIWVWLWSVRGFKLDPKENLDIRLALFTIKSKIASLESVCWLLLVLERGEVTRHLCSPKSGVIYPVHDQLIYTQRRGIVFIAYLCSYGAR